MALLQKIVRALVQRRSAEMAVEVKHFMSVILRKRLVHDIPTAACLFAKIETVYPPVSKYHGYELLTAVSLHQGQVHQSLLSSDHGEGGWVSRHQQLAMLRILAQFSSDVSFIHRPSFDQKFREELVQFIQGQVRQDAGQSSIFTSIVLPQPRFRHVGAGEESSSAVEEIKVHLEAIKGLIGLVKGSELAPSELRLFEKLKTLV